MRKREVVIVGGGLAGLSAAYELSEIEDINIHLIEKDTQLGGRIQTYTINGQVIDVGGFLIYPWYQRYYELIKALDLTSELMPIPPVNDYYARKVNSKIKYHRGFSLPFKEIIQIFLKIFPYPLKDSDPTHPLLHAYNDLTIKEYLNTLNFSSEKLNYYINVFDTYLQGYCYGSVSEHKMAFIASTLYQNILHGDVHSASYLKNGSSIFIDAIKDELMKRGVNICLDCAFERMDKMQIITNRMRMQADKIIFCQAHPSIKYSRFITVTVSYSGIAHIDDDVNWGACFYKENPNQSFPILSVVNLEKLYSYKAAQHLNLNIKVNEKHKPESLSSARLLRLIRTSMQQHFKEIKIEELLNRVDWGMAMPIAQEDVVDSLHKSQGEGNIYYAGDFMGCPSMETALMSGKRAAEQLIRSL